MMQLQNQVQISENIQENVGTDVDSRFNILDERLQQMRREMQDLPIS
jgi:hypothetical protein